MNYTVHFGTWTVPFFITIIAYIFAWGATTEDTWGIARLVCNGIATIVGLAAWLTWALTR